MNNKINLTHVIGTLKDGGAQTQLLLLCNNINLDIFNVTIICWDNTSSVNLKPEIAIVTVDRGNKYNLISFFFKIITATRLAKPDLLHLWLPEIITIPACVVGKIEGIPIINSLRRIPVNNFSKLWFRDRLSYFNHLVSTITVANFKLPIARKSLLNRILKGKYLTIFNGLDLNPSGKTSNNFQEVKNFKICYTGRLVPQKNVELIIKAVALLRSSGKTISLDIYGDGYLRKDLESLTASLNIQNEVHFHGYLDNWKAKATTADVFVFPSDREGMPNVLFEAASIGLPLIVSQIEEIKIHFTDSYDALLLKENSIDEIVRCLNKIMLQPQLSVELRKNCLETIKKYSVQKMVDNYEVLYLNLKSLKC